MIQTLDFIIVVFQKGITNEGNSHFYNGVSQYPSPEDFYFANGKSFPLSWDKTNYIENGGYFNFYQFSQIVPTYYNSSINSTPIHFNAYPFNTNFYGRRLHL